MDRGALEKIKVEELKESVNETGEENERITKQKAREVTDAAASAKNEEENERITKQKAREVTDAAASAKNVKENDKIPKQKAREVTDAAASAKNVKENDKIAKRKAREVTNAAASAKKDVKENKTVKQKARDVTDASASAKNEEANEKIMKQKAGEVKIEVAAIFPLSQAQRGELVAPSLNLPQTHIKEDKVSNSNIVKEDKVSKSKDVKKEDKVSKSKNVKKEDKASKSKDSEERIAKPKEGKVSGKNDENSKIKVEEIKTESRMADIEQFGQELLAKESNQHMEEAGKKMIELKNQADDKQEEISNFLKEEETIEKEIQALRTDLVEANKKYNSLLESQDSGTEKIGKERDTFKGKNEKLTENDSPNSEIVLLEKQVQELTDLLNLKEKNPNIKENPKSRDHLFMKIAGRWADDAATSPVKANKGESDKTTSNVTKVAPNDSKKSDLVANLEQKQNKLIEEMERKKKENRLLKFQNLNYSQAAEDFDVCLEKRKDKLPKAMREIDETPYQLGVAPSCHRQFDEAVKYFNDAKKVNARVEKIDKLESLQPRIQGRMRDTMDIKDEQELFKDFEDEPELTFGPGSVAPLFGSRPKTGLDCSFVFDRGWPRPRGTTGEVTGRPPVYDHTPRRAQPVKSPNFPAGFCHPFSTTLEN